MTSEVVGVIPCAGLSSRMGRSKALLDASGAPFMRRVVEALRAGGCTEVVVVVRSEAGAEAGLALELGARVVLNPRPEDGPIGSIRAALALLDPAPEGILVPLFTLGLMCFVAALYPAIRAARMRPAQGMREV